MQATQDTSAASSPDIDVPTTCPRDAQTDAHTDAPLSKRKAAPVSSAKPKKRKLASPPPRSSAASSLRPCAGLPPAVWQHVFLSCSLADLGRLIQVNRSFLSYLTDVPHVSSSAPGSGCLRLLKSESVWASARNALITKPPKPLPGFSELQMWQLAWSKRCQFCDTLASFTPGERIWQKGPGEAGVRPIWPFAVRACGSCLLQQSQTVSLHLPRVATRLTDWSGCKLALFHRLGTAPRPALRPPDPGL